MSVTGDELGRAPRRDPHPDARCERELLAGAWRAVIGIDEVGRGAIAGPVAVGAQLVTAETGEAPAGLRDSKLLSPARRERLAPEIDAWGLGAVGFASAAEIDERGIVTALGLAAARALAQLAHGGVDLATAALLLDGVHNWLAPFLSALTPQTVSAQTVSVQALRSPTVSEQTLPPHTLPAQTANTQTENAHTVKAQINPQPEADTPWLCERLRSASGNVVTRKQADRDCVSVAAASVRAKVRRDALMVTAHERHPGYAWASNKGYGAKAHYAGIAQHGLTKLHRRSWIKPRPGALRNATPEQPVRDPRSAA